MNPQSNKVNISVHEMMEMIFQNKWQFLLCTLIGLLCSIAYIIHTPEWFKSEASIEVVDTALTEDAVRGIGYQTSLSQRFNIVNVRMYSDPTLIAMAGELYELKRPDGSKLFADLEGWDSKERQKYILDGLKASFRLSLNGPIIHIRTERQNQLQAEKITSLVLDNIHTKMGGIRQRQIRDVINQLDKLLGDYESQLEEAEGVLKDFKTLNSIDLDDSPDEIRIQADKYNLANQAPNALIGRLLKLMDKQTNNELALSSLRARRNEIKNQIKNQPEYTVVAITTRKSMTFKTLEERLAVAHDELSILRDDRSDEHPLIKRKLSEITRLKKQMSDADKPVVEQETKTSNDILAQLRSQSSHIDSQLAGIDSEQTNLDQQVRMLSSRLKALPSSELKKSELERERSIHSTLYQQIRLRYENAVMSRQLEAANQSSRFLVRNKPSVEKKPIRPNRSFILLMGIFSGAVFGIALSFVLEFTNTSFRNLEDASRYLDLPVLGVIPDIDNVKSKRMHKLMRMLGMHDRSSY